MPNDWRSQLLMKAWILSESSAHAREKQPFSSWPSALTLVYRGMETNLFPYQNLTNVAWDPKETGPSTTAQLLGAKKLSRWHRFVSIKFTGLQKCRGFERQGQHLQVRPQHNASPQRYLKQVIWDLPNTMTGFASKDHHCCWKCHFHSSHWAKKNGSCPSEFWRDPTGSNACSLFSWELAWIQILRQIRKTLRDPPDIMARSIPSKLDKDVPEMPKMARLRRR